MPERVCKLEPGSLRTTPERGESPSSASAIRGEAIATKKSALFITEAPRDELPS